MPAPAAEFFGVSLANWLENYAQHRVSAKTFERYSEIVHKHLIPAVGSHRLGKLLPMHLQAYYGNALTKGRVRLRQGFAETMPPLSAHTIKHHHRVLSQALRQVVRLRLIARNPCDDVDPPKPKRVEMTIISEAQSATVIKVLEDKPLYIPVLLAITTGMRRGEILALRWGDLILAMRSLQVRRTLEETRAIGISFKEPKSERNRRNIALPALAIDELQRHRRQQAEGLLRIGIRQDEDTLICCDPEGRPLSPRAVSKSFAELSRKMKLGIRFHDLRHTHISHLLAAGVHPKVASERAGHASIAITMDTYSHLIPGLQEDAADRIDAALRTHLERRP